MGSTGGLGQVPAPQSADSERGKITSPSKARTYFKGVIGPLAYIPNDAVPVFTVIANQFSPESAISPVAQLNQVVTSGTNRFTKWPTSTSGTGL